MIYKLTLFNLILFIFTACGKDTKDIDRHYLSCHEINKSINLNKETLQHIDIDAPTRLNILVANSPKSRNETTSFDKDGLYTLLKTEYLWADETPRTLNITDYNEPQQLINDAKYIKDRWSFAITHKQYNNAISQKSIGFGFRCQDIDRGCLVTYVRIDSPVDRIDLRRGDIVLKIDGQKATQKAIYTKGQEKGIVTLDILRPNSNQECSGEVTPREYNYKVVESKTIKTTNNEEVGYLRIDSFLGDSKILKQLNSAFDKFKKESIQKLIIDLRYNGGGSVDLASKLLDKLVIDKRGQTQFTLTWNKNYSKNNQRYTFENAFNALDLKQIIFLTTKHTASASELIISALKAYLPEENIVIIGDRTDGKPVGMVGQSDGSYYYFLINFLVKNALGFYDYFDGLPVTSGCNIVDDPFHEMGDRDEAMLKSALLYIDRGSCQ